MRSRRLSAGSGWCDGRDLGMAIQSEIEGRGFRPISNLTGHGLDQYVFTGRLPFQYRDKRRDDS